MMVPALLRSILKRGEIKKTLSTGDYKTACRQAEKYAIFCQQYFELIETMSTHSEIINFLIRNHFEKCLMDAEDHTWGIRKAKDYEPDQDQGQLVRTTISNLKDCLEELKKTAVEHEYTATEETIATDLLNWQKYYLKPFDDLFKELSRGILDAKIEATRMQIAYLERDGENMIIRSALFQGCKNYLQTPDFEYSSAYEGTHEFYILYVQH